MNTPSYVTSLMIWNELQEMKKQLEKLTKNNLAESLQEVSVNQACKILKQGRDKVVSAIEAGEIKARKYKASNGEIRYRIRIVDIKEFQEHAVGLEKALIKRKEEDRKYEIEVSNRISQDFKTFALEQIAITQQKIAEKNALRKQSKKR
jgi:hypothetical protein